MSRPRKIILLCCSDDHRRSELSFILDVRSYRVIGGVSAMPPIPDCALVVDDGFQSRKDAREIASRLPGVPILVLPRKLCRYVPYDHYPSGSAVMEPKYSMEDALERLRLLTRRKRGPKTAAAMLRDMVSA
jgi:hypothetical protein